MAGDELLTREGREYRLTPLAVRLQERTRVAVSEAERLFAISSSYDPAQSTREFTIHTSDYTVALLGSRIAAILEREAPLARLRFTSIISASVDLPERTLLSNDLIIMPHGFLTDVPHQDLYQDTWTILFSADHPDIRDELTEEHLRELPWVISYHGPTASTPAIRQLRMLGIEPRVQVIAESFLALPALIAGTCRITLLQHRVLALLPGSTAVRALPCPFPCGPLAQAM